MNVGNSHGRNGNSSSSSSSSKNVLFGFTGASIDQRHLSINALASEEKS